MLYALTLFLDLRPAIVNTFHSGWVYKLHKYTHTQTPPVFLGVTDESSQNKNPNLECKLQVWFFFVISCPYTPVTPPPVPNATLHAGERQRVNRKCNYQLNGGWEVLPNAPNTITLTMHTINKIKR